MVLPTCPPRPPSSATTARPLTACSTHPSGFSSAGITLRAIHSFDPSILSNNAGLPTQPLDVSARARQDTPRPNHYHSLGSGSNVTPSSSRDERSDAAPGSSSHSFGQVLDSPAQGDQVTLPPVGLDCLQSSTRVRPLVLTPPPSEIGGDSPPRKKVAWEPNHTVALPSPPNSAESNKLGEQPLLIGLSDDSPLSITLADLTHAFYGPYEPPPTAKAVPNLYSQMLSEHAGLQPTIHLEERLQSGLIWEGFLASLCDSKEQRVVKLANISSFPASSSDIHVATKTVASEAIMLEYHVYRYQCPSLQGQVIPFFDGLYGSIQRQHAQNGTSSEASARADEVWIAVMEYAGLPIPSHIRNFPRIKNEIRSMYSRLHLAGVIHDDVSWKHILYRATPGGPEPEELRIVDFGHSTIRDSSFDEDTWSARCEIEMEWVEALYRS
ncbi:hypothetical protein IAU59_007577 [Kwoniella sp. CBS 9459]